MHGYLRECYPFVMGPERALLNIEAWIRRTGDSTEKPKFEKVDSFAFKKFETFIILCVVRRSARTAPDKRSNPVNL